MIWYLLSPLRGTTQPPRLSSNHPVRRFFYRHGKVTAQHWLVAMMISVAVAMGFSYPTIFLSDNPTAGLASSPHHVWTTAKPIDDDAQVKVDVEVRQVWVHGSYMNALDKHVLKRALVLQQSLLGNERLTDLATNAVHSWNGEFRSNIHQWGFHSPLMYWNNSAENLDADQDLLKTINQQKHSSSSLNVVLRPASVFAGKQFSRYQLKAADALVITLLNKPDDSVGRHWQTTLQSLTEGVCEDCTLFPHNGHVTRHSVYEFSFTPLTIQEHVALACAYIAMALYVVMSLRRIKAFHSRFGLAVTAITQMTFSILASFTICGILRINLSMIPQNAYPFVVLVLGVENMFRLINAVLAYPATMATEFRIANALGDIGPISVAAAAQNLLILFLLSTFVSPGVAAFCAFAAIATLFDAFFLLTFFVAVLNVDIRRLELQDAISTRHTQPRHGRRPSPAHHTWFDALVQGRLPFSTRLAGTLVTTAFILSLNFHFFEHREKATSLRRILGIAGGGNPIENGDFDTFVPPPMNATLTPGEWMRMQDFDTAKEVMRLAKPGADSFVVRLFAPLIVVLGGSDRTGVSRGDDWSHAMRSFAIHHFYPVAVAIVFAVAFVTVLMNFLLYNEAGDDDNDIAIESLEEPLTLQTVVLPHTLDIVKMTGNENGHFATVALDRTVAISIADRARQIYHTTTVPAEVLQSISWPIRHLAIDDNGEWIACHCADDSILAYNFATDSRISTLVQYPDDHPAVSFAFVTLPKSGGGKLHFLVLTSGGRLAMSCMEDGASNGSDLSIVSLVGASLFDTTALGRQLLTIAEDGRVTSHTWNNGTWTPGNTQSLPGQTSHGRLSGPVTTQLCSNLDAEVLIVTTATSATFLSSSSLAHLATFDFGMADVEIERLLVGPSRKCPSCGGLALRKLAAAGTIKSQNQCILTTWSGEDDDDASICLGQRTASCRPLQQAVHQKHTISNPEAWSAVRSQAVLGLRRCRHQSVGKYFEDRKTTPSQLRQRRHTRQVNQADDSPEKWEAYRLSINGDFETLDVPFRSESGFVEESTPLYVNHAGPAIPLDSQAIAVAFGNTVNVIRAARRGSTSRRSAAESTERQTLNSKHATIRRTR